MGKVTRFLAVVRGTLDLGASRGSGLAEGTIRGLAEATRGLAEARRGLEEARRGRDWAEARRGGGLAEASNRGYPRDASSN